jgi:intracellular septation protein A
MKNYWQIARILFFLIVGIFNTVLIRPEDVGTWKNYLGFVLLIIGIIDAIFLFKNYFKGRKDV